MEFQNKQSKAKCIGNYELKQTLGEGAWGKVKLGIHKTTKQKVAIKTICKNKVREQNMGIQIKREVNILKQMKDKNPHVVQLYEVLASKSKIYLVLELVTGGELFDKLVNEHRFSEAKAKYFFRQLVTSIAMVHDEGICHRDLKPENLLLDENNNLKISDFGLSALYLKEKESSTSTSESCRIDLLHTTCGTPNYVSPEVLQDDGYDGRKADIWSMGVVLYVMVTGVLPFDEPSLPKLFDRIKRGTYRKPLNLSPTLLDLLSRILVPDPQKRISIKDIQNHPWMKVERIPTPIIKDVNQKDEARSIASTNSQITQLLVKSPKSAPELMDLVMAELKELAFAIIKTNDNQVKCYKSSRNGMIGLIITIRKDAKESSTVEIQKARGEIFAYHKELHLLTKCIKSID